MNALRTTIALCALSLMASSAAAEDTSAAYSFLNIPTSSHVYGLGGNNIAIIDDDVTLADQNPALIGPELEKQVAFNYMYYMGTGNFAGLRYGMAAGEHGGWAIGLRYLNYGKMQGYDENGGATGEFTPSDLVVEGTYSRDIAGRWRGGANFKMAYSSYEQYTAFAIAVDLGVNYYDPDKDLSFSVVLKNMGGQVKRFDTKYNRVPFDIQIGYMQTLGSLPLQLSITANNLVRWRIPYYAYNKETNDEMLQEKSGFFTNFFRHLIFGLQLQPSEKFYLDLAYSHKARTDMSSFSQNFFSGFSIGAGFRVKGFAFGVAYGMPHKSASTLMVNLNCSLDELLGN